MATAKRRTPGVTTYSPDEERAIRADERKRIRRAVLDRARRAWGYTAHPWWMREVLNVIRHRDERARKGAGR